MLNKKEKQIIQYLMKDRDKFVTSKELAAHLNCSDRTIRTYYKTLVEKLDDYSGIDLISKQGYGYKLDVLDDDALADFLEENHINDHHFDYQSITDINDRYNYLLNKLLFEQNEIYFDDLVDELYVSRSTLSSDFKKIRQKFKPYHLKIESKANKGVYVTGSERDKRRFIMDYFISSGFIDTMHSYVDNELLNQRISFEELTIIVLDECREGGLKLSDFVIQNLVIHIALAIRRITEGFKISKLEEEELKLRELPERQIADNILKRVSVSTGIDFPVEEVDYITLHLISKSHGNARYVSESMQEQMRQELIDSIEKINPEVKNDFQLIEGLLAHLSTMLIRLEGKVVLENPLTTEIQANYQEMYQLAEQVITTMPTFQSFSLTPNEIAYIALHFMAAKERYKEQRKYNVLVICATGYGSAQMLKSRIENELGNLISITDVIGYYEINDEKLKGIDFIVSSIDLSNLIFNIPVFTVSVFLTDEELQEIKHGISHLNTSTSLRKMEDETSELSVREVFDDYFSKEAFFILSNVSKDEVLRKLVKSISKHENDQFEKRMLDMMKQREAMSSIIFGEHIAVPHPMKAVGSKHHFAVALIQDELLWDDQYPSIKIVFLMSMSIHENDGLPELTSAIVDLVDEPDLQEQMLACQSFEEFRTLFFKIKER
ncbi:BglG family transcription antiterminator [Streptococcus gallolyticus]|uniref:Lichenan operon transcriptional antiterminator n=1 Tax=Streptococcus gallolyticus TaxID=315405 RepID=A0AA94M3C5_9STRE|nr:PRD domain-containing protein [Streptococcus gallolyticus]AQP42253.1 lichenan operon transcriptional antiterminator [Streptococcus gallolyticus subsp. gallolyticus DSM 16831]EFM29393.1 putative PRD domain protein, EF_0829/AHA_3910 family [Streptococcus gallolyticus subsp. gallolyticus TX20005]MCY7185113.1 BglG family transcription antiterminator [Streptococcus gallolyticus subsp. gallolyticus]MCY7189814.1 BglG family transcription antiterminator [Streptococcus gallolyticus subsp. gallolyticu